MKILNEVQDKVDGLVIVGIKPNTLLVGYWLYRQILQDILMYKGNTTNNIGMKDEEGTTITLNFTGASLKVIRSAQMKPDSFEVLGNERT